MKKVTGLIIVLICISFVCYAQQAISTAGGGATGTGGTVSYTIGQVAYTNMSASSGEITEGVQQPFEILIFAVLPEAVDGVFQCLIFPNPATEQVAVKIENYNLEKLYIRLYDENGKLMLNTKVINTETSVPLTGLPTGSYLLNIFNTHKVIRSFQIIKYQMR